MCRVRLIEAKAVKARGYYSDNGANIVLLNMFGVPLRLSFWVFFGILLGEPFMFKRGDIHVHAKFSINNKVYSFRTSQRIFASLSERGFFSSNKFKTMLLDGSYH